VGNLSFDPGSLSRATGEIVTDSEVSRVFRGTDNRQSVLGSWGPSTAREGRPKGDIASLISEVIEGRVANGAVILGLEQHETRSYHHKVSSLIPLGSNPD